MSQNKRILIEVYEDDVMTFDDGSTLHDGVVLAVASLEPKSESWCLKQLADEMTQKGMDDYFAYLNGLAGANHA